MIEANKNIREFSKSEYEKIDKLKKVNKAIFKTTDTNLIQNISTPHEKTEERRLILELKLVKDMNDNEAEIMDYIQIIRIIQKQKKIPEFRINYEQLFVATWNLETTNDGNYLLDGSPYEIDEEEWMDTPFEELLNE